jgi:SAM-dependent methyltransferase
MNTFTPSPSEYANYDGIADFYHQHWSSHYHEWVLAALRPLLLDQLPRGSHILDVCCGTGTMMKSLMDLGYVVSGLDASAAMLDYARQSVPSATLWQADARRFRLDGRKVHAAISTFDSLSHILSEGELLGVFRNVLAALRPDGQFLFDLNMEEAYVKEWHNTCAIVGPAHACFVRGEYDEAHRLGTTHITLFDHNGEWMRSDTTLYQRCYDADAVVGLLRSAGFAECTSWDAAGDLGLVGKLAVGRRFFQAWNGHIA